MIEQGQVVIMGKQYRVASKGLPDGEKVICAVRQEKISLGLPDAESLNGTVIEATYYGSIVRCRINIDGETSLTAEVPVSQAFVEAGENVGINIQPKDILIFPHDNQ